MTFIGHIGVMPKSNTTKLLAEQAVSQLKVTSAALAALKQEMQVLASKLPECPVVMEMFGVGPTLSAQLMAEIGDVRRFHSKRLLWPMRVLMHCQTIPGIFQAGARA